MKNAKQLTPEEAVKRFKENPNSVIFPLATFGLQFGLTSAEVLAELKSGRLIASGRPTKKGVEDLCVTADSAALWLVIGDPPLVEKAYVAMNGRHRDRPN